MPWILIGLTSFLALVWVLEFLDRARKEKERQGR